ncbi:beta-1,3-galactosyltransferase bre-5-like [Mytilus edulis]|uniref:beta-1,3-galactosyltransferase bre-5-like n=1 Tax=Mytilus edulis TaxID=6550 RepID=UPI0039EF0937
MTDVVHFESKPNKDIIILNVEDAYKNIVYKSIYSLICLSTLNIRAEFVHLVDDDRLVNAVNVYDVEKESVAQSDVAMQGYMFHAAKPFRRETSKNNMSWNEYPFVYFPPHIVGETLLTNMKTVQVLVEAVKYVSIIQIEDVLIGIVANAFKINMRHHSEFLPYKKPVNQ